MPTDNHNFDEYEQGDTNWEYNTEFNHIEERLPIRDVEANRSNYTPHDGAIFVATDTGAVYDGDGSSWNEAGRNYGELSIGDVWLGQQTDTPTDSDIGSGNVAFYAQDDGNLYTKPYGGTESQVGSGGGGSSIFSDSDGDGIYDQTDGTGINTGTVSGDVYARDFDGANLAEKIDNAIAHLDSMSGGRGCVRVTPKDNGTAWDLGSGLNIDVSAHGGVEIRVADNAEIEYSGSGYAVVVDSNGGDDTSDRSGIYGGIWRAADGTPDGWLQLRDIIGGEFHPNSVDFRQDADVGSGGQIAVSVENHNSWCELNHFRGHYIADIAFDFKTGSVTGGEGGTKSFDGTTIEDVHVNVSQIGMRLRGSFHAAEFRRCNIFTDADNAVGMEWSHSGRGMIISSLKIEQPGAAGLYTGNVGIRTTTDYSQGQFGPLIVGLFIWQMDGGNVSRAQDFDRVCVMEFGSEADRMNELGSGYDFWIRDLDTDREFRFDLDNNTIETGGAVLSGASGGDWDLMLALTNIEDLSGTSGHYDGDVRLDDGTNTPNRATM